MNKKSNTKYFVFIVLLLIIVGLTNAISTSHVESGANWRDLINVLAVLGVILSCFKIGEVNRYNKKYPIQQENDTVVKQDQKINNTPTFKKYLSVTLIALTICCLVLVVTIIYLIKVNKQINIRDFILPYDGSGKITISESGDYITSRGTWVASNQRDGHIYLTDQINGVDIYCNKNTKKCLESRVMISRLDKKYNLKYDLFIDNFEYAVKKWDENYIEAEMSGPGKIFTLNIDLNNKKIVLSIKDNPENPTAANYIDTATLENSYAVWDSLKILNN